MNDHDFDIWAAGSSEPDFNRRLRQRLLDQRAGGSGGNNLVESGGGDSGGGQGSGGGESDADWPMSIAMVELLELFDTSQTNDVSDSQSSSDGWVSVQLEQIYQNYQLGQNGLTWNSLDLFPPGPSSVGNSLNLTINGMPSAVGWSLDLYPPALCGH